MSIKKIRLLIGAGLLTGTLAVSFPAMTSSAANRSLTNLPTQELDVNINIQNNPNINNSVKVENNNTNTNNNTNNNTNTNNNQNNNENTNNNNNNNENKKKEKPKPTQSIEGDATFSQPDSKDPHKVKVKGWANTSHVKVKIGSHEYSIQLSNSNESRQSFEKIYTLSSTEKGTLQGYVYAIGNKGNRKQIGQGTITIKGKTPPPPPADEKIHDPQGNVESLSYDEKTKRLSIKGWALDEDNMNAPVNVQVYVGGDKGSSNAKVFSLTANQYHTTKGQHGFNGSLSLPGGLSGNQPVHVYALNLSGTKGSDKKIKTDSFQIPNMPDWKYAIVPNGWYKLTVSSTSSLRMEVGKKEPSVVQLQTGGGHAGRTEFYLENVGNNIFVLKHGSGYVTLSSANSGSSRYPAKLVNSMSNAAKWKLMYEANASYKKDNYGEYYIESVAFPGKVLTDSNWDGRAGYNGEGYDLGLTEPKSFRWNLTPANPPAPDIPTVDGKASLSPNGNQKVKVEGWANTDRIRVKVENIINDEITLVNSRHENKNFGKEYQLPSNFFDTHSYEIEAYNSSSANNIKKIGEGTFTIPRPVPTHAPTGNFEHLSLCEDVQIEVQDENGNVVHRQLTEGNKIRIQGWAKDEDAPNTPLKVHVYIGGVFTKEISTNANGVFNEVIPVNRVGWQDIDLYAIDNNQSENVRFGEARHVYIPWRGIASMRHAVYRTDQKKLISDGVGLDGINTGTEKVYGPNDKNGPDHVVVIGESNDGYYLIRYWSHTKNIWKDRWIQINGGGIIPQ